MIGCREREVVDCCMKSYGVFYFSNTWIVGRHSSTYQTKNYCSFCDTSTTFGRCVDRYLGNKSGYWATANSPPGGRGSHFSKWPPTVGQNVLNQ